MRIEKFGTRSRNAKVDNYFQNMAFKEYKGLDLVAAGNEILDRWKKNHAFEKSLELREGAPEFK